MGTDIDPHSNKNDASDNHSSSIQDNLKKHDFHGAAVIDKDGKEVPITDEMVDNALKSLDESSQNA